MARRSQDSTADLIQYASVAGELARNLWGRTDFEKYDSAWAVAQNWIVDYRGGLFSRPGFEFGDIVQASEGEFVKFFEFQYSPDTTNTYVILFTDSRIRFIQDNAYVLEADVTIDSVANGTGNRITITATGHGFSDGDWVKLSGFTDSTLTFLNNRTVEVANKTANTFDIDDPADSSLITKASINTDTGTVNRIYTVTSPYSSADLERLQGKQIRDYLRLTHPDYPIKNLIRSAATSWAISNETIGTAAGTVTGLALDSTDADNDFCYVYQVTAVDENGEEGLPDIVMFKDASDFIDVSDRNTISWTAVTGAISYNIYRSLKVYSTTGSKMYSDSTVGYIGNSVGTTFSDPDITPDFSRQPPIANNPFADGRIKYVSVTAGGAGYAYDSTITWPAGGSGAYGFLVCEGDGSSAIRGVIVLDGGSGYTGTTVTAATGTGATMTATLSDASGNNPHCCALFQQRMIYGATDNNPLTIYGSRPGRLSNFDISNAGVDNDAYELEIDSEKVAPIRHLISVRGGLLVFNQIGVWILYGRNSNALTADNAQIDPQNSVGSSIVQPVYIDSYVIYVSSSGQEVRMLAYDDYSKVYEGQNVSLLSNHLFSPNNDVTSLTYAPTPHKVVWATQETGRLLSIAIDTPNSVYACTPHSTRGYFREVLAIQEDNESRLYAVVERIINGNTVFYFERQAQREWATLEESFCVDSGLRLTKTAPSGRLIPSSLTGNVTFTVSGATPFSAGDVGKIIRCGSGRATITSYTGTAEVDGTWTRDLEETFPETSDPMHFTSGNWWMDSTATDITGLWHLIGEDVSVLADGAVITGHTVDSEGGITLATAASRVAIGLGYTCKAQTLPLTATDTSIEGRKKDIVGVACRIHETYGLKIGASLTKLYEIHDRANVLWSTAARLRDTMIYEVARTDWSRDNQIFFVQDSPRPATILNFIRDVDLGDDKT